MNAVRTMVVTGTELAGQNVKVVANADARDTPSSLTFYVGKKSVPKTGDRLNVTIAWNGDSE